MYDGLMELRRQEKEDIFDVIRRALTFYHLMRKEEDKGIKFMFKRGGVKRELVIP